MEPELVDLAMILTMNVHWIVGMIAPAFSRWLTPNLEPTEASFSSHTVPHLNLDGKHTVFGKVTEGQEVVDEIKQGDVMQTVVVLQKRDHDYEVEKL